MSISGPVGGTSGATGAPLETESTSGSAQGSTSTLIAPPYPGYRGLRWEEEYALERMISGVTVPSSQGRSLPVKVFWKDPARELNRLTFPHMMLEFLDMTPRRTEEVRGSVNFGMELYTGNYLANGGHTVGEFPVPVLLYYQCTVNSRVQQHDVILNDICATSFFPIRYGQLNCASGTARRLDFESMVNRDHIEADTNQRLYSKVWTISISAEIVPQQGPAPTEVTEVDLVVENGVPTGPVDANIILPPT